MSHVHSNSHITSAASSPATLQARCLVLASISPTHYCSSHILRFLLCFTAPVLGSVSQLAALWEAMFPLQLLLHHLDQYRNLVEAAWWQEDWLLALITDISTIGHCLLFLSL